MSLDASSMDHFGVNVKEEPQEPEEIEKELLLRLASTVLPIDGQTGEQEEWECGICLVRGSKAC